MSDSDPRFRSTSAGALPAQIPHTHWLNTVEFPYERRAYQSPDGVMHYVDIGQGKPIVFVHGCPTWSFLYRKFIAGLSNGYRCIAIDHLGLGLSEKPKKADYRPAAHSRRLEQFIDDLDLMDVTIVGHDFGASIAMDWAARNQHRTRDVILFNTWLWSLHKNPVIRRVTWTATSALNQYWFRLINPSPKFYLPILFADHHKLPKWVQDQFQMALNNQWETFCADALTKAMSTRDGWLESVGERFAAIDKPTLILWGEEDTTYGGDALFRLQQVLPNAATVVLPGVGNYVPEEAPTPCIKHIRAFLS